MLNHGDTEPRSKLLHENLTEQVIGAAIEVHRALGPGLAFRRQVPLPVEFKGIHLECGYRMDILVEDAVILELKCVEHVLPVHEAQLLTYLKMTGMRVGLILNFHVSALVRGGIVRKIV